MTKWRHGRIAQLLPSIAVVVALLVSAGVGLLIEELLTDGDDEGSLAAIVPAGGDTATSCPSGTPPPAADAALPSLAYVAPDDTIWIVSADGSNNVALICDAIGAGNAAWSPTDRFMAHASPDGSLWVLDLDTGQDMVLDDGSTGPATYRSDPFRSYFRWSPVADVLIYEKFAVPDRPIPLGLWAVTPGGAPVAILRTSTPLAFAWSPDGQRIVYQVYSTPPATPAFGRKNQLFLVNVDGSGARKLPDGIMGNWSPDGRLLAYWESDRGGSATVGDINVMEISTGREVALGEFRSDEQPQWAPVLDRYVFFILAIDWYSLSAIPLFDRPSAIVSWSPDGTRVAYVEGRSFGPGPRSLVVLDIQSGRRTTYHTSNADTAHALNPGYFGDWSPDGRYFAFVGIEPSSNDAISSALYVADTQSGEVNRILGGLDVGELSVSYSPDGSRLLIQHGRHQSPAIWIARADGSQASKIVDGVALRAGGAWRPATE